MTTFSLDEAAVPVNVSGSPSEHWMSAHQRIVTSFATFPVDENGRMSRTGTMDVINPFTGKVEKMVITLPPIPDYLIAKPGDGETAVNHEIEDSMDLTRNYWLAALLITIGALLFVWYWLK